MGDHIRSVVQVNLISTRHWSFEVLSFPPSLMSLEPSHYLATTSLSHDLLGSFLNYCSSNNCLTRPPAFSLAHLPTNHSVSKMKVWLSFLFFFFINLFYLFLAALGRCCARLSLVAVSGGYSSLVRGLLIAVASVVAVHGL